MPETTPEPAQSETLTEGSTAVAVKPEKMPAQLIAHDDVMAVMPRSIEEASRYATGLCNANIVPDAFRYSEKEASAKGDPTLKGQPNHGLVLMGILKCLEVGVPPQTGLAGLLPLNGRFTVWGDLAAALVQRTGLVKKQTRKRIGPAFDLDAALGEWPLDYGWHVQYWRVGQDEPYEQTYTVRDAKRQRLWLNQYKKPWLESPDRMLFNRARAFVLRDGFADGLHGLAIAEEVMDHMDDEPHEKAAAPIASLIDDSDEQQPEEQADA